MRKITTASIVLILGAAGAISCSSSSSQGTASSPKPGTTAVSPTVSIQRTAQGTRIFGPQLELVRDDKGIRGQSPRGVVDLTEEKGGFSGSVGSGPTNLRVEPTSEGNFTMRGMFAGSLGELDVRDDRIQGQLGRCQFDLRAAPTNESGKYYNGQRVCGGAMSSTTLTLSPQIEALAPLDRGALIALILSQ